MRAGRADCGKCVAAVITRRLRRAGRSGGASRCRREGNSCKPNEADRIAGTLLEDMETRNLIMKAEVKGMNRVKRTRIVPGPNAPAEAE